MLAHLPAGAQPQPAEALRESVQEAKACTSPWVVEVPFDTLAVNCATHQGPDHDWRAESASDRLLGQAVPLDFVAALCFAGLAFFIRR